MTETDDVVRIHQEVFCQALSVFPSRKYEEDGGPTMADMAELVRTTSSPASLPEDRAALAALFVFNLLVAGVDAHAKNHAMLHLGGTARLAPAYDLISAHGFWDADRVAFKSSAAVKYGKERKYRLISGRNIARAGDVLGIPRSVMIDTVNEMAHRLPDAFEAAIAEVPADMMTEQLLAMPVRIGTFAGAFVNRVRGEDLTLTVLPRFRGATAVGQPSAGRIWEPGDWRNGRWITGRYRTRPQR